MAGRVASSRSSALVIESRPIATPCTSSWASWLLGLLMASATVIAASPRTPASTHPIPRSATMCRSVVTGAQQRLDPRPLGAAGIHAAAVRPCATPAGHARGNRFRIARCSCPLRMIVNTHRMPDAAAYFSNRPALNGKLHCSACTVRTACRAPAVCSSPPIQKSSRLDLATTFVAGPIVDVRFTTACTKTRRGSRVYGLRSGRPLTRPLAGDGPDRHVALQ